MRQQSARPQVYHAVLRAEQPLVAVQGVQGDRGAVLDDIEHLPGGCDAPVAARRPFGRILVASGLPGQRQHGQFGQITDLAHGVRAPDTSVPDVPSRRLLAPVNVLAEQVFEAVGVAVNTERKPPRRQRRDIAPVDFTPVGFDRCWPVGHHARLQHPGLHARADRRAYLAGRQADLTSDLVELRFDFRPDQQSGAHELTEAEGRLVQSIIALALVGLVQRVKFQAQGHPRVTLSAPVGRVLSFGLRAISGRFRLWARSTSEFFDHGSGQFGHFDLPGGEPFGPCVRLAVFRMNRSWEYDLAAVGLDVDSGADFAGGVAQRLFPTKVQLPAAATGDRRHCRRQLERFDDVRVELRLVFVQVEDHHAAGPAGAQANVAPPGPGQGLLQGFARRGLPALLYRDLAGQRNE